MQFTKEVLKEVLETLNDRDMLKKREIGYRDFLDILDIVNKNLRLQFQEKIRTEMVKEE